MPYVPPAQDPLRIPKPEPGWHYRWLADDAERLSGHLTSHGDRPGYVLVKGKNLVETKALAKKLGLNEHYVDELRGWIRYGRLVLGRIPIAEARRRTREKKMETLGNLREAEDSYFAAAQRRGIRPFIKEVGDVEDRRKFATRESDDRVSMAGLDVPSRRESTQSPAGADE